MTITGCTSGNSLSVTDEVVSRNTAATSGPCSRRKFFNAGIEAYFKMVNDAGGIDGRKIEFIHYDDEFDPTRL